jgi:hypothetical protein
MSPRDDGERGGCEYVDPVWVGVPGECPGDPFLPEYGDLRTGLGVRLLLPREGCGRMLFTSMSKDVGGRGSDRPRLNGGVDDVDIIVMRQ